MQPGTSQRHPASHAASAAIVSGTSAAPRAVWVSRQDGQCSRTINARSASHGSLLPCASAAFRETSWRRAILTGSDGGDPSLYGSRAGRKAIRRRGGLGGVLAVGIEKRSLQGGIGGIRRRRDRGRGRRRLIYYFRSFARKAREIGGSRPGAEGAGAAHQAARRGRPRVAAGAGEGPPPPPARNGARAGDVSSWVAGQARATPKPEGSRKAAKTRSKRRSSRRREVRRQSPRRP